MFVVLREMSCSISDNKLKVSLSIRKNSSNLKPSLIVFERRIFTVPSLLLFKSMGLTHHLRRLFFFGVSTSIDINVYIMNINVCIRQPKLNLNVLDKVQKLLDLTRKLGIY